VLSILSSETPCRDIIPPPPGIRQSWAAAYHTVNKCFPPAYIADKNGKPMHSWRVLILPYLAQQNLYKQYDFNEPWDGPNNKKLLAARIYYEYACPSDKNARSPSATQTSYVAVVGTNAAWPGVKSRDLKEIAGNGGTSNTIMLVEVANSGIQWTEPRDLSLEAIAQAAADDPNSVGFVKHTRPYDGFFFYHDTIVYGANVAFADGSVRFLPAGALTAKNLRDLLQVGGFMEAEYDLDSWTEGQGGIHWTNCIALAIWLVSVGLLLYRAVRSRHSTPHAPREVGSTQD
jgi:prepilin-type processing-associated H-X9-DG protein